MSNVHVQDECGGAQHPLGEQSSAGSAVGEEGLGECSALQEEHL